MISKITELYILCRDIQVSTEKKQFSIEMISKMTEPCILSGDNQIPTEKSLQHWNDFKDQTTLNPLWGHSSFNWKKKHISIEMISKMTEPYILCGDIQIPTEKDSSLSKWLQRWHNFTFFVGTFKFQLKKTVQYFNDFKYKGTLHLLLGHSNSNWKRQFSIEMITKMTELYILCGVIQIPTEKTVQYRNDCKDHRTLNPLWGHSSFNWKKNSLVLKWFQRWQNHAFFVETFMFQLKNQFSIEMI